MAFGRQAKQLLQNMGQDSVPSPTQLPPDPANMDSPYAPASTVGPKHKIGQRGSNPDIQRLLELLQMGVDRPVHDGGIVGMGDYVDMNSMENVLRGLFGGQNPDAWVPPGEAQAYGKHKSAVPNIPPRRRGQ